MKFLEITFTNPPDLTELLIAELSFADYDSFMETETGFVAYIQQELFQDETLRQILEKYPAGIRYQVGEMEDKNWNEEWEKNFQPVTVAGKCMIRASFHRLDPAFQYDVVINPKMSFGTGHHETTALMVENQLSIDHKDKKVLDAGSGTGILAIMASKLGASEVLAYDIEDWAFENLKENVNLNDCRNIKTAQGTIKDLNLSPGSYDIILANINRNVLLDEIPAYSLVLKNKGILVLSGFYEEDVPHLENAALNSSLQTESVKSKNRWVSMVLRKN